MDRSTGHRVPPISTVQARAFAVSRRVSPELCSPLRALSEQRAQGRPGAGWHPRSAAQKCSAKRPHSSIQV